MIDSIWECTIIIHNEKLDDLPNGADWPPRKAATEAIESLGLSIQSVSSRWGCDEFTPKIASLKRKVAELEKELTGFKREHSLHCKIIPSLEAHNLEQRINCVEHSVKLLSKWGSAKVILNHYRSQLQKQLKTLKE